RDDWYGKTPLVLRPQSTDEVAQIVKICARHGSGIVPQGDNTGLTGAGQPRDDMTDVVLSTARMKAIRDIDTVNDTITVDAGVVLKEIQNAA
ncbi:FAD-binding oxidoreductase, partial [Acinetobacter baumannii]